LFQVSARPTVQVVAALAGAAAPGDARARAHRFLAPIREALDATPPA
jgi:hypothetical protein